MIKSTYRAFILALVTLCVAPMVQAQRSSLKANDGDLVMLSVDHRQIAITAALILAGYSATPETEAANTLRAQIRNGLVGVDEDLVRRLRNFYSSKRTEGVEEAADAVRYRALGSYLNPPPSFSMAFQYERIPADVKTVEGFAPLVGELYRSNAFRALLPTLEKVYEDAHRDSAAPVIANVREVFGYFRELPTSEKVIPPVRAEDGKILRPGIVRVRQVRVYVDPVLSPTTVAVRGDILDASYLADSQRPGDRYAVYGGSRIATADPALRLALIRFGVAPIVDEFTTEINESGERIRPVVLASVPSRKRYEENYPALVEDSLVSAIDARLQVLSKRLSESGAIGRMGDDFEKGAVLNLQFYDRLKNYEAAGFTMADFFPDFVRSIDIKRQKERPEQIAAARSAYEIETRTRAAAKPDEVAADLLAADRLIGEKRFVEARPILERILTGNGTNARALYGLAQVVENVPDPIEVAETSSNEDRFEAQTERLETSVRLYQRAALNATSNELWLASWSHVFAGRILDFLELRDEAVAEYRAAAKIGDVPNGAYDEAMSGIDAPYDPTSSVP